MTNSSNSSNSQHFLLPSLKSNHEIKSGKAGDWEIHDQKAFEKVAKSLDFKEPGEDLKSVSSIPNMWARALSMEMALHDRENKLRKVMLPQWEGMLAALALKDVFSFKLEAQLLDLNASEGNIGQGGKQLARSLRELAPSDRANILYKLENGENPWQEIYVFLWNGSPVGATSPSTLVYPSEDGNWSGLPWWNDKAKKLDSPRSFINDNKFNSNVREQLWLWLDKIEREFSQPKYENQGSAISRIQELIQEFRDSLVISKDKKSANSSLKLNQKVPYFQQAEKHGCLIALNYPIELPTQDSNVQLCNLSKNPEKPAILVTPDLLEQWGETKKPENVWIYERVNFGNLAQQNIGELKRRWEDKVTLLEPDDLLLPESDFYYIVQEEAFTTKTKDPETKKERVIMKGALLPDEAKFLKNNDDDPITPLLPIRPIWLDYFTPEELIEIIEIEISEGKALFTIRLTLSGIGGNPREYLLKREYPLNEAENGKPDLPVLEIWPNFIREGWQEYYAFYSDGESDNTFGVDLLALGGSDNNCFQNQDGSKGNYQVVRLKKFPRYIACQDPQYKPMGLILLPAPELLNNNGETTWTVGVDFGTSFSNVYVNKAGQTEPLTFTPLALSVTASKTSTRSEALYEFFMDESVIRFPLSSVVTTRGTGGKQTEIRPVLDGRIYIPTNPLRFNPQAKWIGTGLKWSKDERKEVFLKHLALEIVAHAAKENVNKIQWAISYPTAYSENYISTKYIKIWQELAKDLKQITGIEQTCPTGKKDVSGKNNPYYLTESVAIAKYFDGFRDERQPFDAVTCIDVGGGTSDISIWQDSKLIHQCSVKLAGRDLFSRILARYPDPLFEYYKLSQNSPLSTSVVDNSLSDEKLDAKLDALLRENSEKWLKNKPDELEFFQEFRQIMTIGWAGLYYYVGIILKVLHQEGKWKQQKITPVYIGGNGSRLLHWIEEGDDFYESSKLNGLFSRMMAAGAGFPDNKVKTRLSQNPKKEVAIGLVLEKKNNRLQGLEEDDISNDILIAGEAYKINEEIQESFARMQLGKNEELLNPPSASDFIALPHFLLEFHLALGELKLTRMVKPLELLKLAIDQQELNLTIVSQLQLWAEVSSRMYHYMSQISGTQDERENESSFTIALKSLIDVLAERWASKWKRLSSS